MLKSLEMSKDYGNVVESIINNFQYTITAIKGGAMSVPSKNSIYPIGASPIWRKVSNRFSSELCI